MRRRHGDERLGEERRGGAEVQPGMVGHGGAERRGGRGGGEGEEERRRGKIRSEDTGAQAFEEKREEEVTAETGSNMRDKSVCVASDECKEYLSISVCVRLLRYTRVSTALAIESILNLEGVSLRSLTFPSPPSSSAPIPRQGLAREKKIKSIVLSWRTRSLRGVLLYDSR